MHQTWLSMIIFTATATFWAGSSFNTTGESQAAVQNPQKFNIQEQSSLLLKDSAKDIRLQFGETAIVQKPSPANKTSVNPINTQQIRKILDVILAASKRKDVNTVMRYIAPKATLDLTVQSPAGNRRLQLNRAQYQQYLQQGFEVSQTYDSKLSNVKVQIVQAGKAAIATYTITETVSMNEPPVTVSSSTDSTVRFERVNGQILATQMRSTSMINIKPL